MELGAGGQSPVSRPIYGHLGGLDATLADTGRPLFLVDLRSAARLKSVAAWLATKQLMRSIGGVYSEELARLYETPVDAAKSFDAILFVEHTAAARRSRIGPANR